MWRRRRRRNLSRRQCKAFFCPGRRVHHKTKIRLLKISNLQNPQRKRKHLHVQFLGKILRKIEIWERGNLYLLVAVWTIMVFMPEAVQGRQKKAKSTTKRHQTAHNGCQTRLWSEIFQHQADQKLRGKKQKTKNTRSFWCHQIRNSEFTWRWWVRNRRSKRSWKARECLCKWFGESEFPWGLRRPRWAESFRLGRDSRRRSRGLPSPARLASAAASSTSLLLDAVAGIAASCDQNTVWWWINPNWNGPICWFNKLNRGAYGNFFSYMLYI